jgi:hypothetical protein
VASVFLAGFGSSSHYLTGTGFGFSIPSNAIISSIQMFARASADTGLENQIFFNIVKGGTVTGTTGGGSGLLSTSLSDINTLGTPAALGVTLTPSDVNSSNFGMAVYSSTIDGGVTTNVDSLSMIVSYTFPGTVSYFDNASPANGAAITWRSGGVDPSGNSPVGQTYNEANSFTTTSTISNTADGEWDLSMYDNGAAAGSVFCFRTVSSGGAALASYSQYPRINTYNPPSNSAPNTPVLSVPSSGATGVSITPTFSLSATDPDSDAVKYRLYLYQSDCSTAVGSSPFAQASSGTGWDNGTTAYSSGATANYTYQGTLSNSTTYCWKADAIDPGGTNGYGSASSTQLFTTAAAGGSNTVTIQGGVDIRGGSTIQ